MIVTRAVAAYHEDVHPQVGSPDQHDTLVLPVPGGPSAPSPGPAAQAAPQPGWARDLAPAAPSPGVWPGPVTWAMPAPAPVVVIRRNDAAVVGATLGSLALFMSLLPLIGILAWVIAPVGMLASGVGLLVGARRHVGRAGAWWGLLTSALALGVCVAWVGLVLAAL